MKLYSIDGKSPKISPDVAFIDESVIIIGDVVIEEGCTIFQNVVLEGFPNRIVIGARCNIQSGTVVHGLKDSDTYLEKYCTVGHRSILHGCYLEEGVTIGMGSIIMGYSKIGKYSIVGAGSLVTERKEFPAYSMILGSPAKFVKELEKSSEKEARNVADLYFEEGIKLRNDLKLIN
jgi:carbonic anhydrase/acetyltransferase-like protein (isoleucine patch superfamily)